MEQVSTPLNAAQLDFLQLLGHIKTEEELDELRQVVSDFITGAETKRVSGNITEKR